MSTVKFGLKCDVCGFREDNYHVDTIRSCEECGKDLCPACATGTGHVAGAEADVNQAPTWVEGVCSGPAGPCLLPLGHPGDHVRPDQARERAEAEHAEETARAVQAEEE